jgi:mRNA-degrading endonuclease RelE of RelBE toxin-antitoxin system
LWPVLQSKFFEKQLKKLDPQIAREIIQDMECLKEDPLQSLVYEELPAARNLGLRYIKVSRDWRVFFRIKEKNVLVEFVYHRESAYEEVARRLRFLSL